MNKRTTLVRFGLAAAVLSLAAACAGVPPPDDALARADFALVRAERAGAGEHAPLELRNARKSLQRARSLAHEEEYLQARRAAEIAEVEAALAESLSLAVRAESEAEQSEENLSRMREELRRRGGGY